MASPAVDDYLKTIYAHTEWQDAPITPSVLAGNLGVAPSSATQMVKKLAAQGLVAHEPYRAVRLTEAGERRALEYDAEASPDRDVAGERVRLLVDEVHDEAEILEHSISDRLLEKIDERLGRPRFYLHGDAIPDAAGRVERVPFVLLADAALGHTGAHGVSDRDPRPAARDRGVRAHGRRRAPCRLRCPTRRWGCGRASA